jgi:hypothetical protein
MAQFPPLKRLPAPVGLRAPDTGGGGDERLALSPDIATVHRTVRAAHLPNDRRDMLC